MRSFFTICMGALAVGLAGPAFAAADLFSPETLHGLVDLRLSAANGEASFTDGGYGKARFGGGAGGATRVRASVAEAALEWKPRLNWEWSAVIDATAQPGQKHAVDVSQAYIVFKPVPHSDTRFQAKAGLFYPPISLEHDAPVWGVINTITPSAINSWVGEEVKVVGVEGQAEHDFGDQQVSLTGAVFGYDDTSGTLLTYRGWALHDLKSTAGGKFSLPPLSPYAQTVQDNETYSTLEIDHRVGWYARLEWRPTSALTLDAFHYDNRGNRVGVTPDLQWAWDTRFTNFGARLKVNQQTRILAQLLYGHTYMGFPEGTGGLFADVSFRSAYGLVSHDVGKATLTARADVFDTIDHSLVAIDNNNEHGWSLTGAVRYAVSTHADVRLEALHVWSDRPGRAYGGLAAKQAQTVFQSSLRLSF